MRLQSFVCGFLCLAVASCAGSSQEPELSLETHAGQRIASPRSADLVAELDAIHPADNAFVCLSSDDGSYVQAVGSSTRLTVEWRAVTADGFTHWVLGAGQVSTQEVEVACVVGPITVRTHEVLSVADAKAIFAAFAGGGAPPADYGRRDVSDRFR